MLSKSSLDGLIKYSPLFLIIYFVIIFSLEAIAIVFNIQFGMLLLLTFINYKYIILFGFLLLLINLINLFAFKKKQIRIKDIITIISLSIINLYLSYLCLYCSTPNIFTIKSVVFGTKRLFGIF